MKLEPVYLLAPPPEPRRFSRRSFFGAAAAAFLGGLAAGGISGWRAARGGRPDPVAAPPDAERPWEQWAAKLATQTDEQLLAQWEAVVQVAIYSGDRVPSIWSSVERIAEAAIQRRVGDAILPRVARRLIDAFETHPDRAAAAAYARALERFTR